MRSVLSLLAIACAATPAYEKRDQPVDAADVAILKRADEILADESRWNRHDDRNCDPTATTWSLFCALQKACVEVLGSYDHRRVALQEVRFAIEDVAPHQEFQHRLMDFNNLPSTQFADVKKVLAIALERVQKRMR